MAEHSFQEVMRQLKKPGGCEECPLETIRDWMSMPEPPKEGV